MKNIAGTFVAIVGISNALPRPVDLSSLSLATPTAGSEYGAGSGSGSGTGSNSGGLGGLLGGGKLPIPSGGSGLGGGLGGLLGGGSGLPNLPNLPIPTGGSGLSGGLGGLLGGGGGRPNLPNLPIPSGGAGLGGLLGGGGNRPNLPIPTGGAGLGGLLGGGGSGLGGLLGGLGGGKAKIPTTTGAASSGTGFDLGNLLGGLDGIGGGLGGSRSSDAPTSPSKTDAVAIPIPTQTGSAGGNNTGGGASPIGGNCTPQAAGRGSSENGISDKACCTDMTVVFARGTGEPGNVGIISGPPMFKALREKLGNDRVTVQGVDYPASAMGNANMGADGGKKMADMVTEVLARCPSTKVIVSGYSQGGMVVHNAFKNGLSASKVAGAVQFGDPFKRQAIGDLPADKAKQFCGATDQICGGGGDGGATGGHLSYGSSADAAATFAIQAAGLA